MRNDLIYTHPSYGIEEIGPAIVRQVNTTGTRYVIEIGAFEGRSTRWFCENYLVASPNDTIVVIDPFENNSAFFNGADMGDYCLRFEHNTSDLVDRMIVLKKYSHEAKECLDSLFKFNCVDIAYIDGSHEFEDALRDAEMVLPFIKSGGVIVFDDTWMDGPLQAANVFLAEHPSECKVLEKGKTYWIVGVQ